MNIFLDNFLGISDRVQCAFCAGALGNWEDGDIPSVSHKKFFGYCKMAQSKFNTSKMNS